MKLYFFYDFSLAEIAEKIEISRQGVYDHLQRTEKILRDYENKLGLVARYNRLNDELNDLAEELNDIISDPEKRSNLQKRIDELKEKI